MDFRSGRVNYWQGGQYKEARPGYILGLDVLPYRSGLVAVRLVAVENKYLHC